MKKILLSFILLSAVSFTAFSQCSEIGTGTTPVTTSYLAGQSFTASCSGDLNYVQFTANTTGTVPPGTLYVYAGAGTGTTPIHTQAFGAITIANVGDPIQIGVSGSVPVTSSSVYTFEFFVNLDIMAGFGTYAGGDAYQSGTQVTGIDTQFEANIVAGVGIDEVNTSNMSVFPNPATDVLNISTENQLEKVSIFSVNGALVKIDTQSAINVSNLDKGMYLLTVQTDKGITQIRFIKE